MYCTRADIEHKRIAVEHLLQLMDDEQTGEFYDGAGAIPPNDNTLPLYSDATSVINTRITECIEDASNEIDTYLGGIYAVPIADDDVPPIVNTLAVNIATYYCHARRNTVPETIQALYDNAIMMLRGVAARKITLPIPKATDDTLSAQSVFAVRTRAKVFDNLAF